MEKHTCHVDNCNVVVPPKMLMCANHWRRVPQKEQLAVYKTYKPGQEVNKNPSNEWLTAAKAAIASVKGK